MTTPRAALTCIAVAAMVSLAACGSDEPQEPADTTPAEGSMMVDDTMVDDTTAP